MRRLGHLRQWGRAVRIEFEAPARYQTRNVQHHELQHYGGP